jgi:hypothetical protein
VEQVAFSIDPLTYIISIPKADLTLVQSSPTEIRELNLNNFRLELKSWEDSEEGIVQPKTHTHNTEVNLSGLNYARIVEVLLPYSIEFEDGQYTINCVGANHNLSDVKVANQVSLIVNNAAGLIGNAQIEYGSFDGMVHLDPGSSNTGTIFPVGTPQSPVNNLADALLIASVRGFVKIRLYDDLTISGSVDLTGFSIEGRTSDVGLTIETAPTVADLTLESLTISDSTFDGDVTISFCSVKDCVYVDGYIYNCGLAGDLTLAGGDKSVIDDCYTSDQDDPPVIDMGGSGNDLAMPNYSGLVTIKNLSGASNELGIGLDAGYVTLDSTITAGSIIVSGVGILDDNSTGTAVVNTEGLLNKTTIATAVWDEPIGDHLIVDTTGHEMYHQVYNDMVTIDTANGTSGTTFPTGSEENPVDNLADALTICAAHNFKRIHIHGALTIDGEDVTDITFTADRSLGNSITITSMVNTDACYFEDLTVSGALSGSVRFTTCVLGALDNFDGGAKNCLLTGAIEITGSGFNYFTDCDSYVTGTNYIEIDIGDHYLNFIRGRGAFQFNNKLGATKFMVADFASASVILDSSCTEGFISISGNVSLTDNSAPGCILFDGTFTQTGIAVEASEEVWTNANGLSVLSDLAFLTAIEGGKWEISGTQMIFYDSDNTTEIARFDLTYDANNYPIMRTRT